MNTNPTILAATTDSRVLEVLYGQPDIHILEAHTTDGVQRSLGACHLAVVDAGHLLEGGLTRDDLAAVLEKASTPWLSTGDFLADPERHLAWARQAARSRDARQGFAPRTVALLSFAGSGGGVGKTTLALHAARRFRHATGLPALVGEFCFGASGLAALTASEDDIPQLYDLASDETLEPATWHDVSLAPLDYAMARLLRRQDYEAWYNRAKRRHTLLLLDVTWPNDLFPAGVVDRWLIVAHAGRRDTLYSALRLRELLQGEGYTADVLVNFYHRGDGLFLSGMDYLARIPQHGNAARLSGELGKYVLDAIYPNWSATMERRRLRLFGGRRKEAA
ncbi:MAG: hypothetical protein D6796_08505 [Caldilineae bacterium]|nr:MAG: hypothetical protein D6796_08505 [Caldilineae bacterium]